MYFKMCEELKNVVFLQGYYDSLINQTYHDQSLFL